MSGPVSPQARRLYELKLKQAKKVEGLNPRRQPKLPAVLEKAELEKYQYRGVPRMSEFLDEEESGVRPVSLDEIEAVQVNFEHLKRCLRCRKINPFAATDCRYCRGRFVFDKTGIHIPKRKEAK